MKKKLSLKDLKLKSFITETNINFNKKTVKGGSDLLNPCGITQQATCPQGCDNFTNVGCGNYTVGCPTKEECPTYNNCHSRPPACTDLFSPCDANTASNCTL